MQASSLMPGVFAIAASLAASAWWRRYRGADAGPALRYVLAGGLAAARAAFVLSHLDVYAGAPLEVFNLADGGWHPTAGIFAAFAIGAELTRKKKGIQKPLMGAAAAGALAWMLGAALGVDGARAPLPAVALKRLDGTPVDLRTLAGKPIVLNLWASWCPPCRREMPVLGAAQARHPDLTFVFVNHGEDAETIRRYLGGAGLELGNVFSDRMGKVGAQTGSSAFPTTLFYDKRGVLVERKPGELSAAALEEKIVSLRSAR